ncbi:MAG: nuclear transport factor 2 family protein [Caldilineaceae bacterium]
MNSHSEHQQARLAEWHRVVFAQDYAALSALLAPDVQFRSPFFWKAKTGAAIAAAILTAATTVFDDFTYHREWLDGNDWALEFSAQVGELSVKGIDLIRWDDAGRIVDFEVLVRPANGLQALGMAMAAKLAEMGVSL